MRQIGMRQEASRLGGIGSCGRELCCSTWLTDFKTVSTSAARYQNLSLNTLKLAGQCGKLKCCLNYELDTYMDALKDIPDNVDKLETDKGIARLQKTDIFKKLMWFSYPNEESWIPLKISRVLEIQQMNKEGEKPEDLKEEAAEITPAQVTRVLDYENVVGQDSITRLDEKSASKKKKKKRSGNKNKNNGDAPAPVQDSKQQQERQPQKARPTEGGNGGKSPRPNNQNQGRSQNSQPGNQRNAEKAREKGPVKQPEGAAPANQEGAPDKAAKKANGSRHFKRRRPNKPKSEE